MGAVGGGLWHLLKGMKNSPSGHRMIGGIDVSAMGGGMDGGVCSARWRARATSAHQRAAGVEAALARPLSRLPPVDHWAHTDAGVHCCAAHSLLTAALYAALWLAAPEPWPAHRTACRPSGERRRASAAALRSGAASSPPLTARWWRCARRRTPGTRSRRARSRVSSSVQRCSAGRVVVENTWMVHGSRPCAAEALPAWSTVQLHWLHIALRHYSVRCPCPAARRVTTPCPPSTLLPCRRRLPAAAHGAEERGQERRVWRRAAGHD